jgi:hypothetical protein
MDWTTIRAIFSQTHMVTLILGVTIITPLSVQRTDQSLGWNVTPGVNLVTGFNFAPRGEVIPWGRGEVPLFF